MEMQPVQSSSIEAIGYDASTRILRIRFTSQAEYQYYEVPQQVWKTLMYTASKGTYLQMCIRGQYAYECVVEKPKKEEPDAPKEEKPSKGKPKAKRTPV